MSYDTQKSELGRQPVHIVEIDQDYCLNTYGTAPCTAAIGVTGTAKCFNTRKTCQDPAHYLVSAVWDAAKAGPGVTVSGADALSTLGDTVLSVDGHSTGQWYGEVEIGTPNVVGCYVGIAEAGIDLTNWVGQDVHGWGYYGASGLILHNNVAVGYGATFDSGDVIGIAFDGDAGTVTFYKNGVSQGVAFSGLTGVKFIAFNGVNTMSLGTIHTALGQLSYPLPAGFTAWSATNCKTYRFSDVLLPPCSDPSFVAIPAIASIGAMPTMIDPNAGIAKRAALVVTLKDFAHPDIGLDRYLAERGYDSEARGTFWTKWLARNPYYQNRVMRDKVGYLVDGQAPDPANFQTRLYLLQEIAGPDKTGMVKLTAQDPLKLLDDVRAKAPLANTGVLYADITAGALSATLTPSGIGDEEYPAAGTMVMGNELATFTRVGDVITFTARGTNATTAASHSMGEAMQVALVYTRATVTQVLYDLLVNYAGIPASYIDLAAWNAEASIWLTDYQITTVISKPVGVSQLVGELAVQCLFFIWWDERSQLINLSAIHPPHNVVLPTVDDANNVVAGSQERTEDVKNRKTQIWVCYGQKDPTQDLAKPYNYGFISVVKDDDAEGAFEYGDQRIEVIYSRWLDATSSSVAEKLARRRLNRYRDPPKTFKFRLDAKDSALWTGDVVMATIRSVVDFTGAEVATMMQVLEVQEAVPGSEYEYTLQDTQFKGRYAYWAPDNEADYLTASDADRGRYAWWANDTGLMNDATTGYQYV